MSTAMLKSMPAEGRRVDVPGIRYAQCWEDADILVEALDPGPGKRCLSIASAGDNTLALLARSPAYVLAIDRNPAQLACLELRAAAYRELQHGEMLRLLGSNPCPDRMLLYRQCRTRLSAATRTFWDEHAKLVENGMGGAGKFETYFRVFRMNVLPLIHSRRCIHELLQPKSREERIDFYQRVWDSQRWRAMFRVFFSRQVMGALGRDREFFRYVEGDVAGRILTRTRYALTELDPAVNPYVQWILTGQHKVARPFALREENFQAIRRNLDRLEVRHAALDDVKETDAPFECFNLSDIFEYMSPPNYAQQLKRIVALARPGARLAYWNMLAPRRRPPELADSLDELAEMSARLFAQDKAFFYSAFVVEQVR
jgi:S-adenosylmethionine-diacylglycerol 3-amino-3-carboxypropyl transferase